MMENQGTRQLLEKLAQLFKVKKKNNLVLMAKGSSEIHKQTLKQRGKNTEQYMESIYNSNSSISM
jgi:uroporphyrinogen-III synthase